jgi:hypothetical protein
MSYDKYNYTVPTLARFTRSVIAQHSLLEVHPDAAEHLAGNANLHRDVWFRLARKPKAAVAYELVKRPLDLEQLMLFTKDTRVTVRRNLVTSGLKSCTEEMGEYLLAQPWFDRELATLWSATRTVPDSLRKRVALLADGNELVRHLADRELFSDDEVKALLVTVKLTSVRQSLYNLMDLRPELVDFAAHAGVSHPRLVEAAAGSRHLFGDEAFAAVMHTVDHLGRQNHQSLEIYVTALSNPNTPLELLEQMVSRFPSSLLSVGSRFRPATNSTILEEARRRLERGQAALDRPWDSYPVDEQEPMRRGVALLGASRYPSLRGSLFERVTPVVRSGTPAANDVETPAMNYLPAGNSPVRLTAVTVAAVTDLLDPHGAKAWEAFWSLIDTWQGDLASLVNASIAFAD